MINNIKNILLEVPLIVSIDESKEKISIQVEKDKWIQVATTLFNQDSLAFDFLSLLTCVDRIEYFEMVYLLTSYKYHQDIKVKIKIADKENPQIDSVSHIWLGANLQECEVYDMFGIIFNGHPDLKRIFLDDSWVGFPLRKNYHDEINMIEL